MAEHTPTPWSISGRKMKPSSEPYGIIITGERSDGFQSSVAFCARHPGIDTSAAEANAAFIIKAVNNHDALVRALTVAAERLEARGHNMGAREAWRMLADLEGTPQSDACVGGSGQ